MANSKKKKSKKIKTVLSFAVAGKPPKGKARAHFVVAVFPNGAIGIARATKGDNIEGLYDDARSDAESSEIDGVMGSEDEKDANIAFYRIELVLAKPVVKAVKPPKSAKAKVTKMPSPEPKDETDNVGVVEPDDEDDDDYHQDPND